MKKFLSVLLVFLLVCVSAFCFYMFFNKELRDLKEGNKINQVVSAIKEVEAKEKEKSGKEIANEVINRVRKEMGAEDILGYMSTGDGGINEPFMWAEDDRYLDRNVHNVYDGLGTIFLYRYNSSPMDEVTTYFGHRIAHSGIRFSPIGKYESYKDKLKELAIYTSEGILKYKLSMVVRVNRKWYDDFNTWSREGLREFWEKAELGGIVYDKFSEYQDGKKYVVLSSCDDVEAVNSAVAIYELIEFKK